MNVLDIFSGAGGMSLGLERAGMRTIAFCEIEPYCRLVLRRHWPLVPIFDDVRDLNATAIAGLGPIDCIAGGFPCTDASVAGKGAGLAGEHTGLWRHFARLVAECRPAWVLAENVPGLRTRGADRVLSDLETLGYTAWPLVVGADDVGAPHKRKRVWIVAHRDGDQQGASGREPDGCGSPRPHGARHGGSVEAMGDARGTGSQERHAAGLAGGARYAARQCPRWPAGPGSYQHEWEPPRVLPRTESGFRSHLDGLPERLVPSERREALRAMGNAVVPQVVEAIGRAMMRNSHGAWTVELNEPTDAA